MKNVLKWYMLAFLLVNDFLLFAQPPEDPSTDPETPSAPINTKLIWLAIVGISFAYYYFSNKRREQLN